MSWAAHQFEVYAVHAHLPKKMRGKVSFWGIWLGDFTPDFLSKFWVYGITIGGTHYGASNPQRWHRGWPGMGITHTLFLGVQPLHFVGCQVRRRHVEGAGGENADRPGQRARGVADRDADTALTHIEADTASHLV